jgi:hypothetical protein
VSFVPVKAYLPGEALLIQNQLTIHFIIVHCVHCVYSCPINSMKFNPAVANLLLPESLRGDPLKRQMWRLQFLETPHLW